MKSQSANLDLLRAVAVTGVVLNHLIEVLGLERYHWVAASGLKNAGHLGVLMFFIHTSLVLMMSLDRQSSCGQPHAVRFYIRRFFRIYPLSVLVVVLVVLLHIPGYFHDPPLPWPSLKNFAANLLLIQNVWAGPSLTGPLWSLPFEVQMYLLLPAIFMLARRIRSWRESLALLALGFILWWTEARLARALHYPALLEYAPWFFMGASSYGLFRVTRPTRSGKLYVACLISFVGLCLASMSLHDYRAGWLLWILGAAFALTLPLFYDITAKWPRLATHTIATYSFSIYLTHVLIMWFAFQKLQPLPALAKVAVFSGLMVVIPWLLYHLVEAPMISFGSRIASASDPRNSQAARAAVA